VPDNARTWPRMLRAFCVGAFGDLCAHLPDGAEKFTAAAVEEESNRLVPSPDAGYRELQRRPTAGVRERNLCYQIEHHLFRGLPSNRYAEIATRVRGLCDNFDLPTSPGLLGQYLQTIRTI
jgi:NADPH-dependent stearoyl-CoA 9-desaturase